MAKIINQKTIISQRTKTKKLYKFVRKENKLSKKEP
jgi:hypothetical protein